MIISETVSIRINNINIKHFRNFYNNLKISDVITIPISQLTKGSHCIIIVKCDDCEKEKEMKYNDYYRFSKGLNTYLCTKCVKRVTKKTMLKNYGCEYPLQNKEIKTKFINSNIEKYGCEYPLQNILIQEKQRITNNKKYNVDFVSLNEDVRKKQTQTKIKNLIKKYTNYNFISYNNDSKLIKFECDKNHIFEISRSILYDRYNYKTIVCTECNPIGHQFSGIEKEIVNFIENNYNLETILNSTNIISPYELDIYLPKLKLSFEFNGVYWHNELYKENSYHLNKTELCESKGIQLFHIYEDDWIYKQDIIKSIILNKLNKTPNKIFARKTKIKEITDNSLVRDFLDKNHIQGFVGSKVKIGLFYDNELVSLMTFGNRRVAMGKKSTNEGEYELLRFCNKLNTNVIGGASKLFKYFINNYKPNEITTYADRSISQGKLYETLGFKFIGKTQPNYYYVVNRIRCNRFNFRKDKLIREGFNTNKTEHQIMLERKFYRIYNSGNLKFNWLNKL